MDVIYNNTGNILQNVRGIIEITRDSAYQAINVALVQRNWLLGRRIAEEELRRRAYRIFTTSICSIKSQPLLSWTHYRTLLHVKDNKARVWYAKKAAEQTRAVRTLQRNIDSQYYYRLLSSQNAEPVEQKMKHLTAGYHWRAKKTIKYCRQY